MFLVYYELEKSPLLADKNIKRPIKRLPHFDKHIATASDVIGFVISTKNFEIGRQVVSWLRNNPKTSLRPIYLSNTLGGEIDSMCDGVVNSLREAYDSAQLIDQRIRDLDTEIFAGSEGVVFRLLGFLYVRPNTPLVPFRNWSHPKLYYFPLVNVMLGADEETEIWLQNLLDRGLLRTGRLLDRIRHCPQCEYAHLNYVEICPNCSSIAIIEKPFLHCFTCGHVAPEDDFISKGALICPNCTMRLRHIGSDYDRALENYLCSDCKHIFADHDVLAHCQHCDTKTKPEELIVRNVYPLELTDRGIIAVKTGRLDDIYTLLDSLANITPPYFEFFVDWMLNLCRRYKTESFSLIAIRLKNLPELTDRIGRVRVIELVDGFVARLREIIRATDITTRTSQQTVWILLPKTDSDNCRIVMERIRAIKPYTRQPEGDDLEIGLVSFSAEGDVHPGESAKLLLARLEGEIH